MDEKMEQIDQMMEGAADKGSRVHITFKDGFELEGIAVGYSQIADEEDEIPKVYVDTDDGSHWFVGVDEIEKFDVVA